MLSKSRTKLTQLPWFSNQASKSNNLNFLCTKTITTSSSRKTKGTQKTWMSSKSAKETKINSLMRRCSLHAWCTVTTQGQLKHFHKFLTRISQKRMPNLTNQTKATLQTGMTIVQKLMHKLKKMQFRVWSPDLRLNLSYQLQVVWISQLG